MVPAPSRRHALAAVLGATIALCSCANVVQPAAAVVGGVRITDGQLRSTIPVFRFLASLQRLQCGQTGAGEAQGPACSRFALSELIQGQASRAYASAHHISVTGGEVANAIAPLEQQFGGHAGLVRQLSTAGVSFSQLGDLVSTVLIIEKVAGAVTPQVISTPELEQRYQQERLQFTILHARHILVHTPALAARIARRATPANFAALARKYSADPGSASKGGDLGTFRADGSGFDPTFVQAALSLRPGQISGPVHTQFGWHVIWLESEQVLPFDPVRQQLLSQLTAQGFTRWLGRQAGSIDVNPRFGRFDPSTGRVAEVCSTSATTPCPSPSAAPTPS
jgi:parvulin-like peptidyl-prolyl isomerase